MVRRARVKTLLVKILVPEFMVKDLDKIVDKGYFLTRSDAIRNGIQLVIANHPWVKGERRHG